jgi:hypothetical protein
VFLALQDSLHCLFAARLGSLGERRVVRQDFTCQVVLEPDALDDRISGDQRQDQDRADEPL